MCRAVTILEARRWARSIRSSQLGTTSEFWRIRVRALLILSTCIRAFNFSSREGYPYRQISSRSGEKTSTTVYMRFPAFYWSRPATAARDLSGTGRAWRPGGRSIVTPICRRITESFTPDSFSRKHRRDATSITWNFGPDTNSKDGLWNDSPAMVYWWLVF